MSPMPQDAPQMGPMGQTPSAEQQNAGPVPPEARSFEPNAQPNPFGRDGAEPMKRDSFSKSIARATRQKYEAIARAEAAEARLAEMLQQQEAQPRVGPVPGPNGQPNLPPEVAALAEEYERAALERRRMIYEANLERALDRYPDYHAVVNDTPITRAAAAFVTELEAGPDIAYYLGTHRDEALRIAGMPLVQQGYELAKIEAQLETPQSKARAQTKWPEPINPVRPAGNAPEKPLSQMEMDEYARARNKQMKAQRQK